MEQIGRKGATQGKQATIDSGQMTLVGNQYSIIGDSINRSENIQSQNNSELNKGKLGIVPVKIESARSSNTFQAEENVDGM